MDSAQARSTIESGLAMISRDRSRVSSSSPTTAAGSRSGLESCAIAAGDIIAIVSSKEASARRITTAASRCP